METFWAWRIKAIRHVSLQDVYHRLCFTCMHAGVRILLVWAWAVGLLSDAGTIVGVSLAMIVAEFLESQQGKSKVIVVHFLIATSTVLVVNACVLLMLWDAPSVAQRYIISANVGYIAMVTFVNTIFWKKDALDRNTSILLPEVAGVLRVADYLVAREMEIHKYRKSGNQTSY